jgi:hypothetical protein
MTTLVLAYDARRKRPLQRFWPALVAGALLAAMGTVGYAFRDEIYFRYDVLREQARCAAYTRPPTDVVAELDRRCDRPMFAVAICGVGPSNPFAWLGNPLMGKNETVFLHERRRPDGTRRIVAIERCVLNDFDETLHFTCRVFQRAGIVSGPREFPAVRVVVGGVFLANGPADTLKVFAAQPDVFAAQPDARDASHFTIAYERNGERGTIDGWLTNDDKIRLHVRDGPGRPLWKYVESGSAATADADAVAWRDRRVAELARPQ